MNVLIIGVLLFVSAAIDSGKFILLVLHTLHVFKREISVSLSPETCLDNYSTSYLESRINYVAIPHIDRIYKRKLG